MKLYYKSNNPTISSPFNLLNVQPDRRCRDSGCQSPVFALWVSQSNPSTSSSSPSAPHSSVPCHAPQSLPDTPPFSPPPVRPSVSSFTRLLPACDPLKMLLGCCSWTHLLFPRAVAVLRQKGTQNPSKRLHLFCIQRILEQKSMRFKGGKKPKHLRNAKPFSSVNQNYF